MTGVIFRDVLMNTLMGFMVLVLLILPHINPPVIPKKEFIVPPGHMSIFITWPEGNNDVDLWILPPGEDTPVGYSNKHTMTTNLLRDDRGQVNDAMPGNFENAYIRGLRSGEYIVNLHCYSCKTENIPVSIEISTVRAKPANAIQRIHTDTVTLEKSGDQVTAIRFQLDDKGNLVKYSKHKEYRPLK